MEMLQKAKLNVYFVLYARCHNIIKFSELNRLCPQASLVVSYPIVLRVLFTVFSLIGLRGACSPVKKRPFSPAHV